MGKMTITEIVLEGNHLYSEYKNKLKKDQKADGNKYLEIKKKLFERYKSLLDYSYNEFKIVYEDIRRNIQKARKKKREEEAEKAKEYLAKKIPDEIKKNNPGKQFRLDL